MHDTTRPSDGTAPRRPIGIPYARAEVAGRTYFVVCPECGEKFAGTTKGAPRLYAVHYSEAHDSGAAE